MRGPNRKISADEANRVGTINGAYAFYEEIDKGLLEMDKLADMVVPVKNRWKLDPM